MDGVCALTLVADQQILLSNSQLECDMKRQLVNQSKRRFHATGDKGT